MSVIIRLQNLPWSANALDIRNYFRGLSIPEGGVHIVGGELGDAFIAFSTDEDARQAMMLDCGKIKEIQVKLLLSSRSEMHKVIEAARQTVPILSLAPPAPAPAPAPLPAPVVLAPTITPFSAALGSSALTGFGIPGIGNPNEIPQPAVIEPPAPLVSPSDTNDDREEDRKRSKEKDRRRTRSRSRSRDRDRKDRKRDRRDRSRSRDRRRRDRSRSRDRRDRKRDRKDRSRSRERSERSSPRRSRDRRNNDRKSPDRVVNITDDIPAAPPAPVFGNSVPLPNPQLQHIMNNAISALQSTPPEQPVNRFADPAINDTYNKLNEIGKKRNPNAFQGEQNGNRFPGARGGAAARGGTGGYRRDGRSRFDNEPQRDCCVAIRNAPNHTSYGDVRRFFPFLIDKHGIKMINDNNGRRTGNIFVRFCDPRSKQLALQRKNNELKGEQVSVEGLEDDAYEGAVDSFLPFRDEPADEVRPAPAPAPAPACSVLRIAELPLFVKEHDIIKMFSDFSLLSIMLNDCRITRTKTAYAQFVKADDAKMAFERRERYAFGKRQPVITPITDEEYEKEKALQGEKPEFPESMPAPDAEVAEPAAPRDPRQRPAQPAAPQQQAGVPFFAAPFVNVQQPFAGGFPPQQFGGFPGSGGVDPRTAAANWAARPGFPAPHAQDPEEELDCVLMKGLPCDATDRTIVTFLADTGAVPARIHLMLDGGGVPSGDCFCEFRSVGEARRAAAKHGHSLEGCRVTVDLVPRAVVEDALDGPKADAMLGPAPEPPYFEPRGGKRGGFRGRGFDRGGFDRGFDRGGFDQGRGGWNDQGRGGWNDRGRGGFDRGRGGFDRERGRGRGGFDRGFDRGRGRGRGRGGYENGRDARDMRDEDPDSGLEDFGAPGCVLSLENVPFRATVEDILGFFGDFELTQDDVIRRYNERGQPTGDARVAFRTPFDAQRALSTRHLNSIQDRRVSLTLL